MRRLLAALTILLLMPLATVALGHEETASYRDEFTEVSYSGSDGTVDWRPKPWVEIGDDGDAAEGKVHVGSNNCSGRCLTLESGLLGTIGARRLADLGDWASAELHYDLKTTKLLDLGGTGTLTVEVTTNGSDWETVRTHVLGADGHQSVNVSSWISNGFGVRFTGTGLLNATIYIDNVEIIGAISHAHTTTTTTTTTTILPTIPTIPIFPTTTSQATTTTTTEPRAPIGPTTTTQPTSASDTGDETTTTTTFGTEITTTTISEEAALGPGGSPPGLGPRESAGGLQANYQSGLFGSFASDQPEVLGVELRADFRTAVELIRTSWVWVLTLAVLVATLIVTGLDRRQAIRE